MQVPDSDLSVQAARSNKARYARVKGQAPGCPAVAHQRVNTPSCLNLCDVDVVVHMGGGH